MIAPVHPEIQLADWTHHMSRSVLRQMIAVVSRPGILSFAGGLPDPAFFPAQEYAAALSRVLAEDPKALQYSPPFLPLKQHIVQLMAQRGISCTEEQVFLLTGAQQGLYVLSRLFLNPGSDVLLEEVVYTGIQQAIAPSCPNILAVSTDLAQGIEVDEVEAYLLSGARPAFIYVVPDAHNPLGVSISRERRQRLVELAVQYNVPIIEDDPYGFLQYGNWQSNGDLQAPTTNLPPLRALNNSHVFYIGSFSKILAPALRLGWMVAPEELIPKLTVVKEAADLESSGLTQRAVAAYLDAGHLPGHIAELQGEYGRRRNAMLSALEQYFPATARWTEPQGGMFVWVELAEGVNTRKLLDTAVTEQQVAFIPGFAFAVPGHDAHNCLRLNFSTCAPDLIAEGIKRLAAVINHS
ncbi:MAG TPA: PLP-dependent aminotransferase family protein [Anaerolineae bacterium]|nr:PLP-dependent aminotransferase family protein [Anaerolineae bacterium]